MEPLLEVFLWILVGTAAFVLLLCVFSTYYSLIPSKSYYADENMPFLHNYSLGKQLYSGVNAIYEAQPHNKKNERAVVQLITANVTAGREMTAEELDIWEDVKQKYWAIKQKRIKQRCEPMLLKPEERFDVLWVKILVEENAIYLLTKYNKHANYEEGQLEPQQALGRRRTRPLKSTSLGTCCDIWCECCLV